MKKTSLFARLARKFDEELGYAKTLRKEVVLKIFPDHWSFLFGEIALYSFVVLILTGIYLSMIFTPGSGTVIYHGSYAPLDGVPMTRAYRSVLHICFGVKGGLLMRQIHHWAADVFIASIVLHIARLFFTGAFRKPRQTNWRIGVTLLVLAITNGFIGYSICGDLLSGTGVRIAYSVTLACPLIGQYLAFLFFGGVPPNATLLPRFYSLHIFVVPALLGLLLAVHLGIVWRQKHTNYPGPQRDDTKIVGSRLWPRYAIKSSAMFLFVASILTAMGAFIQINPVWIYGPYFGPAVSSGSQPDWYLGWMEGAVRLIPGINIHIAGHPIPQVFYAGFLLGGLVFIWLYLWPTIGTWLLRDKAPHNVLYTPREHPWLSAIGVAVLAFLFDMLLCGGDDIIAAKLDWRILNVRAVLRILLLVMPLVAAAVTYVFLRLRRGKEVVGPNPQ